MLANVVDLEHAAMMCALRKQRGALVLLDVKAAFPSVSHQCMRKCLVGLGMPATALGVIDALYDAGYCDIALGGAVQPGFAVTFKPWHFASGLKVK